MSVQLSDIAGEMFNIGQHRVRDITDSGYVNQIGMASYVFYYIVDEGLWDAKWCLAWRSKI